MILNFSEIFAFLILILSVTTFAQTATELDTLNAFRLSIPEEILEYQFSSDNYLNDINRTFPNKSPLNDSSLVWLQARMMIGSFSNQQNDFGISASKMIDPMFNCYLESQKFATLRTILATVQAGGVAYLAYKHIKKYGFLKK